MTYGTTKRSLLVGDSWPGFNFSDPSEQYSQFFGNARGAFRRMVEGILLYDSVVIPTESFMSLTALIDVFGEASVIDLLDAGILRFVRVNRGIGYAGNGSGLQVFSFNERKGVPIPAFGDREVAIKWALGGLKNSVQNPAIAKLAAQATTDLDVEQHSEKLRHETYMDVLESPYLRMAFSFRNTNLERLTGIEPNQFRTYDATKLQHDDDEIDTLLALARTNLELLVAGESGCTDSSTAMPIGHLLKAKVERKELKTDQSVAFSKLCEIADVPDIGEIVLREELSIRDVINLRDSRDFLGFQDWFHENCLSDPVVTGREYAALLRKNSAVQSWPVKLLRYLATTTVGLLCGPFTSSAASGVDSFIADKLFRGKSPKFFIEKLRQIPNTSKG